MKLHVLDAEMDEVAAPGILAYKAGDCFANLVSVVNEIPAGKDIASETLEGVLFQYVPPIYILSQLKREMSNTKLIVDSDIK